MEVISKKDAFKLWELFINNESVEKEVVPVFGKEQLYLRYYRGMKLVSELYTDFGYDLVTPYGRFELTKEEYSNLYDQFFKKKAKIDIPIPFNELVNEL